MSLTAGAIIDKISEHRSKMAVLETLVLHLKSNYLASGDAGEPEMRCYRADYAPVPAEHINATIADIDEMILSHKAQLAEWEAMPMDASDDKNKKKNPKKKEEANGPVTQGGRGDHPTPARAATREDG